MNKQSRNVCMAQDRLSGMPQTEIAQKHDIAQQHVSRILRKEEIESIINQGIADQVAMIPAANGVIKDCLSDDDKKIALDASKIVFKNTGITPSHTNVSIDKLLIDNRQQNQTEIAGMQDFMTWRMQQGATDVTPDDSGSDEQAEDSDNS